MHSQTKWKKEHLPNIWCNPGVLSALTGGGLFSTSTELVFPNDLHPFRSGFFHYSCALIRTERPLAAHAMDYTFLLPPHLWVHFVIWINTLEFLFTTQCAPCSGFLFVYLHFQLYWIKCKIFCILIKLVIWFLIHGIIVNVVIWRNLLPLLDIPLYQTGLYLEKKTSAFILHLYKNVQNVLPLGTHIL